VKIFSIRPGWTGVLSNVLSLHRRLISGGYAKPGALGRQRFYLSFPLSGPSSLVMRKQKFTCMRCGVLYR